MFFEKSECGKILHDYFSVFKKKFGQEMNRVSPVCLVVLIDNFYPTAMLEEVFIQTGENWSELKSMVRRRCVGSS